MSLKATSGLHNIQQQIIEAVIGRPRPDERILLAVADEPEGAVEFGHPKEGGIRHPSRTSGLISSSTGASILSFTASGHIQSNTMSSRRQASRNFGNQVLIDLSISSDSRASSGYLVPSM